MYSCILGLLLRLYPSAFREQYRQEASRLYSDLIHDEVGSLSRIRLFFDLIVDVFRGLPQAHRNSYETTASTSGVSNGALLFSLIEPEPIRPLSLFAGNTLALALLGLLVWLLSLPVVAPPSSMRSDSPIEVVMQRVNSPTHQEASAENPSDNGPIAVSPAFALDKLARHKAIQMTGEMLVARYINPDKARAAANLLRAHEFQGDYDQLNNGSQFAERLTQDLQTSTGDPSLSLHFSRADDHAVPVERSPEELADYRSAMLAMNCTFEKPRFLPRGVGYLKFDYFPEASICSDVARAALASLAPSRAIILDLRNNNGGFSDMAAAFAAELIGRPSVWYSPRAIPNSAVLMPTHKALFSGKPLYILTSSQTSSSAELFAWNMQMLKRATVIGEITGSRIGALQRIDDHFVLVMHEAEQPTPYGTPDWQNQGVQPDVTVPASDALLTAQRLASQVPSLVQ